MCIIFCKSIKKNLYIKIKCVNFVSNMKKSLFFLLFILIFVKCGFANVNVDMNIANQHPLHETRAVWLTTIGGLDWPHSYAQRGRSIEKQQAELKDILDKLQHAGINTVLLQTRVRATTIFPCDNEPWDGCLSGVPGRSPGYDALAFAIEECHKRGMQLHAWVVTIPVGKWNGAGCKNLRSRYPKLIKKIGEDGYMNPEMAETGDYLARYCADITRRYDIDGIHLDYIRYPETWGKVKDKRLARNNITTIVKKIHDAVKSQKNWVVMSCSPVGKYADLPRQWSHGWNARDAVYQDAVLWMNEGYMDVLFPMMYFKDQNFYPFAVDWQEQCKEKTVVPGLGIYFMSPKEKNWSLQDITREMYVMRQMGEGFCFFRSKFFTDNVKGIYDFCVGEFCRYPSLPMPMKWYNFTSPDRPQSFECKSVDDNFVELSWSDGVDHSDGDYLRYNVYASTHYPVDTKDPRNLIVVSTTNKNTRALRGYYYAVTAVDRYGNESAPVETTPLVQSGRTLTPMTQSRRIKVSAAKSHHSSGIENHY